MPALRCKNDAANDQLSSRPFRASSHAMPQKWSVTGLCLCRCIQLSEAVVRLGFAATHSAEVWEKRRALNFSVAPVMLHPGYLHGENKTAKMQHYGVLRLVNYHFKDISDTFILTSRRRSKDWCSRSKTLYESVLLVANFPIGQVIA